MISAKEKHFLQDKTTLRLAGAKWLNSNLCQCGMSMCAQRIDALQSALYKEIAREND